MRRVVSLAIRWISVIFLTSIALASENQTSSTNSCERALHTLRPLYRPQTGAPQWIQLSESEISGRPFYAFSDLHGQLDKTVRALQDNGLIDKKRNWSGGNAILLLDGDLIDKGKDGLGLVLFFRDLQKSAHRAGGIVLVTIGNHEAELIQEGLDAAKKEVRREAMRLKNKDIKKAIDFIMHLPLGVFIGDALAIHSGYICRHSYNLINEMVEDYGYDLELILAEPDNPLLGKKSLLDAKEWETNPKRLRTLRAFANELQIKTILFGHQPGALETSEMAVSSDGFLVKLDKGVGNGENVGFFHCGNALDLSRNGAKNCDYTSRKGNSRPLQVIP
jgi:hypothetical protein